ncbi:MAG: alcohol dehydrogenase, partial [Hyphomicrobiales bacterium]
FCATHNIGSDIEVIPADKINQAYERVLASDVRYRFVIDTATLN